MLGLLWLLAAMEVLSTSFDLAAWTDLLTRIDGSLPWTTAANSKICYFFDVSQTCSATAIGHLLSQAAPDFANWTPIPADCSALLDGQRFYAEKVASSLFSDAIVSAKSASVSKFELLAQSWVLRVGHYALVKDYATFVAALSSVSSWTTMSCNGENFIYDSTTITKPGFLGEVDCSVLITTDAPPLDCSNAGCSLSDGKLCCLGDPTVDCCQVHISAIDTMCGTVGCSDKTYCCSYDANSSCCVP